MKFISKSSNLLVVLRPGLSAQPLTGTPAKPTISVRFKDGLAEVQQQELIDMMLVHPAFNSDFISAEETPVDPYAFMRQSSEPDHILTELQYGTPVKREIKGQKTQLPPELQKLIQESAAAMAREMLPGMVEASLKNILASSSASQTKASPVAKVKGKPGRKPKNKEVVVPAESEPTTEDSLS